MHAGSLHSQARLRRTAAVRKRTAFVSPHCGHACTETCVPAPSRSACDGSGACRSMVFRRRKARRAILSLVPKHVPLAPGRLEVGVSGSRRHRGFGEESGSTPVALAPRSSRCRYRVAMRQSCLARTRLHETNPCVCTCTLRVAADLAQVARCPPREVRMSDVGQIVGVKHGGLQLTATVRRSSSMDREAVYIPDTASRCFPYSLGSMAWPNSANWCVLIQFLECAISSGAITLLPRLWDRSRM